MADAIIETVGSVVSTPICSIFFYHIMDSIKLQTCLLGITRYPLVVLPSGRSPWAVQLGIYGLTDTAKPLITDPPKSRQPLYSRRLTRSRLTLPYVELEPPRSGHLSTPNNGH